MDDADRLYREVIDRLVEDVREGQGQIGARRARAGLWNQNATPEFLRDQWEINDLLARLPATDREILARMLSDTFSGGVHTALVVLHELEVPPFAEGYEGSPFHDYVGRLDGWEWPDHGRFGA